MSQDPAHEDTIRFLINTEKEIRDRIMTFAGYEFDAMRGRWVLDGVKRPMLNDKGIRFIRAELNQILNKFIPMANLDKKEVQTYVMSYSRRIRRNLISNIENFGINNIHDLDQIKNTITDTAFFLLTQPIEDKGRKYAYEPLKHIENLNYETSNSQPKRNKLGW
jgi:hypothetical protein